MRRLSVSSVGIEIPRAVSEYATSHRRGVTAVEFAIVPPIFFLLIFAGLEFAVVGTIRSTSHNAA